MLQFYKIREVKQIEHFLLHEWMTSPVFSPKHKSAISSESGLEKNTSEVEMKENLVLFCITTSVIN